MKIPKARRLTALEAKLLLAVQMLLRERDGILMAYAKKIAREMK